MAAKLSQPVCKFCSDSLTSPVTHGEYPATELSAVHEIRVDTRNPILRGRGLCPLKIRGGVHAAVASAIRPNLPYPSCVLVIQFQAPHTEVRFSTTAADGSRLARGSSLISRLLACRSGRT